MKIYPLICFFHNIDDFSYRLVIQTGLKRAKKLERGTNMSKKYLRDLGRMVDMDQICSSTFSFTDKFVENKSALSWFEPIRPTITGFVHELEMYHFNPLFTLNLVNH